MEDPVQRKIGSTLSENEAARNFRIREMLFEFAKLFDYGEASDRAVAIVGPTFLDTLVTELLISFLVDDEKEVRRLMQPDGPLGTFGAKVSAAYCLGLIGETIKSDLRLVAKVRNRFAHDLRADFSDTNITSWCEALRWHKKSLMEEPPHGASARDLFQVGVNQLVCHLSALPGLALFEKRQKSMSG